MTWLYAYWFVVLLIVIPLILFAPFEFIAIRYGGPTFSEFMQRMSNGKFGKMWILIWGMLIGGLAVHFNGWCVGCP